MKQAAKWLALAVLLIASGLACLWLALSITTVTRVDILAILALSIFGSSLGAIGGACLAIAHDHWKDRP